MAERVDGVEGHAELPEKPLDAYEGSALLTEAKAERDARRARAGTANPLQEQDRHRRRIGPGQRPALQQTEFGVWSSGRAFRSLLVGRESGLL